IHIHIHIHTHTHTHTQTHTHSQTQTQTHTHTHTHTHIHTHTFIHPLHGSSAIGRLVMVAVPFHHHLPLLSCRLTVPPEKRISHVALQVAIVNTAIQFNSSH